MVLTPDGLTALDNTPRTLTEIANGYNGLEADEPLSNFTAQRTCRYFNDFLEGDDLNDFVETTVSASTVFIPNSFGQFGVASFSTNAAGTSQIQASTNGGTTVADPFDLQFGFKLSYFTRVLWNNTNIASSNGLIVSDTNIHTGVTDGVFFRTTVGNDLEFVSVVSSVTTAITVAENIGDDGYLTMAFTWDGVDTLRAYIGTINTVGAGTQTSGGALNFVGKITTNIPTANLHNSGLAASAALSTASRGMSVDYIEVLAERP